MTTLLSPPTTDPLPHQVANPGSTRYSLAKALRELTSEGGLTGLEAETSSELALRHNLGHRGGGDGAVLHFPFDAPIGGERSERRSLSTATGSGAIATALAPTVVDVLRSRSVCGQLGAQTIADLTGRGAFSYPKKSATVSLSYLTEGITPATESNTVIDNQVLLTPRTVGAFSDVTRRFVLTAPNAAALVTDDVLAALATEVDRAAIAGTGPGVPGQPLGLFANSAVNTVAVGVNGGVMTRATCIAMERALGNANSDWQGALGWIGSPDTRSALRVIQVGGGSEMLWTDRNDILGTRALVTTSVPNNLVKGTGTGLTGLAVGNFADMIIGLWGAATIVINPYLQVGVVIRFSLFLDFDVVLKHVESFVKCADISQS